MKPIDIFHTDHERVLMHDAVTSAARWVAFFCLFFLRLFPTDVLAEAKTAASSSIYDLSLEELMQIEVTTATRSPLKLTDTPAAVTVITAADIRRYGYTNLAEALARVPEVYTRYEGHNFGSDFRGFFTNNTRRHVLYLLNGHRINDRFHFGDFYPDIVADLSTVERIEVMRGPGAALYGNNAILGVVNIITRDAGNLNPGQTEAAARVTIDDIRADSALYKYQADLRHRFSNNMGLSLDVYWFDGDIQYDTRTGDSARPWQSSQTAEGRDTADITTHTDFYIENPDRGFHGGDRLPNFNFLLDAGDVALGAFAHSKLTSWVWPRDNITFNHPDNIRSWGTGAVLMKWTPSSGWVSDHDVTATLSYNINTNREITDFSTADKIGDLSLSEFRLTQIYSGPRFLMSPNGRFFDYSSSLDSALFSDASANANGGGSQFHYAGIDKSTGLDCQFTPYQSDVLTVQAGGNAEYARYENRQWYAYRNGNFIAWAPWGGITDRGYALGAWLQANWAVTDRLSLIGGARYDYQEIETVYRQLGGQQLYEAVDTPANDETPFMPIKRTDAAAEDFTPRLALNYYLNDTDNIRLIYAQAFRAVPPQELIRLPRSLGEAASEITDNYEVIGSFYLTDYLHLTVNAFYLESNITYQWNPADAAFSRGSGWRNTGGSLSLHHYDPSGFEQWLNATHYRLRRPTDALTFMSDLPNRYESLDSPQTLIKAGASYRTSTRTTLAGELYYNSATTLYVPAQNNVEDPETSDVFDIHDVPASLRVNVALRQDFAFFGLNGCFAQIKVDNVFDTDVWYALNMDAQQSWSEQLYHRPNQLPGFGRSFMISAGYRF